jgi:hypothetical protein
MWTRELRNFHFHSLLWYLRLTLVPLGRGLRFDGHLGEGAQLPGCGGKSGIPVAFGIALPGVTSIGTICSMGFRHTVQSGLSLDMSCVAHSMQMAECPHGEQMTDIRLSNRANNPPKLRRQV